MVKLTQQLVLQAIRPEFWNHLEFPQPQSPVQEMSQNETEELGGEEPNFQWGSGRL